VQTLEVLNMRLDDVTLIAIQFNLVAGNSSYSTSVTMVGA